MCILKDCRGQPWSELVPSCCTGATGRRAGGAHRRNNSARKKPHLVRRFPSQLQLISEGWLPVLSLLTGQELGFCCLGLDLLALGAPELRWQVCPGLGESDAGGQA